MEMFGLYADCLVSFVNRVDVHFGTERRRLCRVRYVLSVGR